jgi:mannose-6-phosphate isomerase
MNSIIKITPIFKEKLWGGSRLKEKYGMEIPSNTTGECWAVSAHKEGDCVVEGGEFDGMHLSQVYKENKELFGDCENHEFPLLVKIIDANRDLSIQVHPNDQHAQSLGLAHGKAEAWLILDASEKGEVVVGHTCKSKSELAQALYNPTQVKWLQRFNVRPNQFYYLPGGTVHAVGAGTMVYEIEQNSNVAYRIYDYERFVGTKKRELHLDQALEAIIVPDLKREAVPQRIITNTMKHTNHLRSKHFDVQKFEIDEETTIPQDQRFIILGFLSDGSVNGIPAKAGDHFIALKTCDSLTFSKGSIVIATYIPNEIQ